MAIMLRNEILVCCEEYNPSLFSFPHQINKGLKTSFEHRTARKYDVNLDTNFLKKFNIIKGQGMFRHLVGYVK